jgi:hypothetical protein
METVAKGLTTKLYNYQFTALASHAIQTAVFYEKQLSYAFSQNFWLFREVFM